MYIITRFIVNIDVFHRKVTKKISYVISNLFRWYNGKMEYIVNLQHVLLATVSDCLFS